MQVELFYISVANALSIACQFVSLHYNSAPVAKLVDAPDLGSGVSRRVGSSPIRRTNSADYQQVTTYACENACDFNGYGLLIKQGHSRFFCFVRYVYIRLHTLIIGVSSPLHHNVWGNSKHQRITDKCTPSAVRANHLPLLFRLYIFLPSYIIYIRQFFVYAALTANLLDIYVHFFGWR